MKSPLKRIYVDTGEKLDYAVCYRIDDGDLKFMGWMRKFHASEDDVIIKRTKEELGLV